MISKINQLYQYIKCHTATERESAQFRNWRSKREHRVTRRISSDPHSHDLLANDDRHCDRWLAMTVDTVLRSRGALRPRFAGRLPALSNQGRREDRVRAAPAVSCAMCTKRCAHEHTGPAGASPPSLRNGFTAYFELSPVNGSFATVAPKKLGSRELDASTAASGPHDFAVRLRRLRLSRHLRPSHLTARS